MKEIPLKASDVVSEFGGTVCHKAAMPISVFASSMPNIRARRDSRAASVIRGCKIVVGNEPERIKQYLFLDDAAKPLTGTSRR